MKIALLLLFSAGLSAQTLQVRTSDASGKSGSFSIMLQAPAGKEPLALQWNLSLPPGVQVEAREAQAGEAAQAAGKSLFCAPVEKRKHAPEAMTCLVAGGNKTIAPGAVASFKYKTKGKPASATVRVEMASAVTPALKKVPVASAQGDIGF